MRLMLLTSLTLLGACATVPKVAAPPGLSKHADAIDWQKAGDEAVEVLSGYLRVDTRNPPGNETEGARYVETMTVRELQRAYAEAGPTT